mgnify:CR=1 FL=1
MKYLVAYDISNDKHRTKLSDILGAFGMRVNYSVFEIELNQTKFDKLLHEIELKKLINKKYDSLRFYHICENCIPKSFDLANREDPFEPISYELFWAYFMGFTPFVGSKKLVKLHNANSEKNDLRTFSFH